MRIAAIASLGLLGVAQALPRITRTGKYLYDPQGARFYIKVGQTHFGIRYLCTVPRQDCCILYILTTRVWPTNLKESLPQRAKPTRKSKRLDGGYTTLSQEGLACQAMLC